MRTHLTAVDSRAPCLGADQKARGLWERDCLKAKGVFLAGHSVAMVTYCVTKIIPTCSPMIGQFFDTMLVASIVKVWL